MSKQITKMSRLVNQVEKMFRLINQDFFNNELPTPILTAIPSNHSYAHYVPLDLWSTKEGGKPEINLSTTYLDRPLEQTVSSLLHECVHLYNDRVIGVADVSRNCTYHNKLFKQSAEAHGLICTRTEKYGWSDTSSVISDELLMWVLEHDEFREIEICRSPVLDISVNPGTHSSNGGGLARPTTTGTVGHHRKYACAGCGNSVRATKQVNIICADCMRPMIEVRP